MQDFASTVFTISIITNFLAILPYQVQGYIRRKYQIGVVVNNILNTKWKETQFDTETRLRNEATSVDQICFTTGTPFSAKLSLSYFFGRK